MRRTAITTLSLVLAGAGAAAAQEAKKADHTAGLPEMPAPPDNPQTPEKIALGHQLFWDTRLSKSGKMACLSCHLPNKGWADGQKLSKKDDGSMNTRHTPTLLNAGYATTFYWDGRAPTLEKQIAAAWRGQMGLKDDAGADEIAKKLTEIKGYKEQFSKAFNEDPTRDNIVKALAAYVRTLVSGASRYDRFEGGDQKALNAAQKRGYDIYKGDGPGGCALCHAGALLTAYEFKNIGVGMDQAEPDVGRGKVEATNPAMKGAFRVPTLRNVAKHPPFMHNGAFATLADVIVYFEKPVDNPQLDEKIKGGKKLTPAQRKDLLEFLKALDGAEPKEAAKKPKLPK